MPGFNPDKLNIHELTIEEPEKKESGLVFDPKKDLTQKDLEEINSVVKVLLEGDFEDEDTDDGHLRTYIAHLSAMEILGIHVNMAKKAKEKIKDWSKAYPELNFVKYAGIRKIPLKPSGIRNMLMDLNVYIESENWKSVSADASALTLAGKKLTLKPEEISAIQKEAENPARASSIETMVNIGANLRIIKNDYKPPKELLSRGLAELDDLRKYTDSDSVHFTNWLAFTQLASDLTILSADEVKIPEGGGLELINHKKEKLSSETPQIPETKQF